MFKMRFLLVALVSLPIAPSITWAQEAEKPTSAVGPLLRILQSGNLPEDRLEFVLNIFAERGNAYDLGVVYRNAVAPDGYEGASRRMALNTLATAARRRKVRPDGDLSKLISLMGEATRKSEPDTHALAVELAGIWKLESAAPILVELSTAQDTPPKLRTAALDALVRIGGDDAGRAITQLTAEERPQSVRYLGIAALAKLDLEDAVEAAVAALADGTPQDDPAKMIDALLEQQQGAEQFAAALDKTEKEIAPDVAKLVLRHMFAVGRSDEALVDALSKVAGISTEVELPSPEEMQKLIADVQTAGDPRRGEQIFRRADLNCIKCHALNGAGGNVGPDLVDLGGSQPVDYLIESVLLPEKAVKEEYQLAQVTDYLAGKRYQGIIEEETDDRIVLRGAQGEQIVVNIEDPEEIAVKKGGSLMPQGLVRFLTRDELVDLVSFLSVLGKPGTPYEKNTEPIMRRWRMLQDLPKELSAGEIDDEKFLDHVHTADETAWGAVYSRVDGTLPVQEVVLDDSRYQIFRGEVEVTAAGQVGLDVDGGEDVVGWAGVKRIPLTADGRAIVEMGAGIHPVTLRVDRSKVDDGGIRLRLFTPPDNAAEATVVGGP